MEAMNEPQDHVLQLEQPRVYTRSNWQNFVRWFALAAIVVLDLSCVVSSFQHIATGPPLAYYGKQLIGYCLLLLCNCVVLPSIILEARKVEVFEDRLVIHNLLYKVTLTWNEIRKIIAPVYLKFAVLRTAKFFHLINKRDVERFHDLIQIIRDKAGDA